MYGVKALVALCHNRWWGGISPPRLMKNNFDIRNHDNLIDELNAIVNNNEVAEVKAEYKQGKPSYKVVRINRKVVASSDT